MKNRITIVMAILPALVCFALLPRAQAVSPAPDGCYPGFTTAEGCNALYFLTTGAGNTGVGWYSLFLAGGANYNTGVGAGALALNTADSNTAVGAAALLLNTSGTQNTAVGTDALVHNDSSGLGLANNNAAVGTFALFNNVDGSENTALGTGAGPNIIAGVNNTYVGDFVGTLSADESNTIRIGDLSNGNGAGSLACFIGGIFANFQPVGGSVVEVTLDLSNDKLGWDLGPNQSMPNVPSRGTPTQRGAPGAPAQRPTKNQAMLNDKVEKLQVVVQMQQKQIVALTARLKDQAETFTAQLKEQAAQIQKVSAQVEMTKPAPQVVTNKP